MKFCGNCGKQIDDNAIFCPYCGTRTNGDRTVGGNPYASMYGGGPYPIYDTRPSKLIAVISFISWQIGLILWLIFRRERPGKAQSALNGVIAGASFSMPIFGLVCWLLWRRDYNRQQTAKMAGIAAIVGASVYLAWFVLNLLVSLTGVNTEISIPFGEMMAYVTTLAR